MSAVVLDGDAILGPAKRELAARVEKLKARGVAPGLGTLLVGDNAGSAKYIAMKQRNCAQIGVESIHTHLPATTTQAEVEAVVDRYNDDPNVDAVLLQYPFPPGLDYDAALLRLNPDKDADGLHPVSLGRLMTGQTGPRPCTPAGIQALLAHYEVPIAGRHVVIIGRGLTVGKPLANLLSLKEPNANAAVTLLHTGVADVAPYVREADIVVAAAGSPGIVTRAMIKPGAAVVQSGTTIVDGVYLPDVDDDVAEVAGWYSPVVKSVGPMTRLTLLRNTVEAAERRVQ